MWVIVKIHIIVCCSYDKQNMCIIVYLFQDILSEKLYKLDTKNHALNIGEDSWLTDKYFSVDNFLYARCCVIANGQEAFEVVLNNPSEMPKDLTFEPLLSLAAKTYEFKTKKTTCIFRFRNYRR